MPIKKSVKNVKINEIIARFPTVDTSSAYRCAIAKAFKAQNWQEVLDLAEISKEMTNFELIEWMVLIAREELDLSCAKGVAYLDAEDDHFMECEICRHHIRMMELTLAFSLACDDLRDGNTVTWPEGFTIDTYIHFSYYRLQKMFEQGVWKNVCELADDLDLLWAPEAEFPRADILKIAKDNV